MHFLYCYTDCQKAECRNASDVFLFQRGYYGWIFIKFSELCPDESTLNNKRNFIQDLFFLRMAC
jgi:hypothetical protein